MTLHYCLEPYSFGGPQRPWGEPNVVVTGYFDGETDGLLRCGICAQTYRFQFVDWDDGQDLRIFALARLAPESYESVTDLLARHYGPKRKYWLPHNPALDDATREEVHSELERVVQGDTGIEAVLLTEHIDRDILALHVLEAGSFQKDADYWPVLSRRCRA